MVILDCYTLLFFSSLVVEQSKIATVFKFGIMYEWHILVDGTKIMPLVYGGKIETRIGRDGEFGLFDISPSNLVVELLNQFQSCRKFKLHT